VAEAPLCSRRPGHACVAGWVAGRGRAAAVHRSRPGGRARRSRAHRGGRRAGCGPG